MTDGTNVLFAQGFFLTQAAPLELPSHFSERCRIGEYAVFQDERVPAEIYSGEGFTCVVLGFGGVIETNLSLLAAASSAFERGGLSGVASALDLAVGRWALLIGTAAGLHVFHDAIGARSVFYSTDGTCVASHVGLISKNHPSESVRSAAPRSVSQHYALDHTELDAVRALLPNFRLDLASVTTTRIFPLTRSPNAGLEPEVLLQRIEQLWLEGCRWALQLPYRQLAPITGGIDSRVLAAMLHGEHEELEYFTYGVKDAPVEAGFTLETWARDVQTGSAISRHLGLPHRVIDAQGGSASPTLRAALLENSPLGHGVELAARYLSEFGEMTTVLHRGTALEIGREYYVSRAFTGSSETEVRRLLTTELGKAPDADDREETTTELSARYLTLMGLQRAGSLGYPMTSMVYWELRCGRFQADVLNGLDAAFIPINGFSSRAMWDAMLALPAHLRAENWLHMKLLARNEPSLLAFPINGSNVLEQLIDVTTAQSVQQAAPDAAPLAVSMIAGTPHGVVRKLNSAHSDVLYVPAAVLADGGWAEARTTFEAPQGGIALEFRVPYALGRPTRSLVVELRLNDELLVTEDIGYTSEWIRGRVSGLRRGDVLAIRLVALSALPKSWQGASRLELGVWESSLTRGDLADDVNVGWSSPWGTIAKRGDNEDDVAKNSA